MSWCIAPLVVWIYLAASLPAESFSSRTGRTTRSNGCIVPETTPAQRQSVGKVLGEVFGTTQSWNDRRLEAIDASRDDGESLELPSHLTVYGELGLDALATILDAVGVRQEGECFLDIGSGDGVLVAAASLLYPLKVSRGIEILPTLYERSVAYQEKFTQLVSTESSFRPCPCEFILGDVLDHQSPTRDVADVLRDTTLAVCFATTWSGNAPGRRLPELSRALTLLPEGARVVIVDGFLDDKADGVPLEYGGEFQLYCPDTAPYSMARLYTKSTREEE